MGRFRNFFKTTYHQVVDDIENPESMLKQYLKDTEKEIFAVKDAVNSQMEYLENFKKQQEEAKLLIVKREKQAQIAAKAGADTLADKALVEKAHYETKIEEYESYILETKTGITDLKEKQYTLEREYYNLLDKKNSLIARVNRAKVQYSIEKTLQSLKSEKLLKNLQLIQDDIHQLTGQKEATPNTEIDELDEIDNQINQLKKEEELAK